MHRQTQMTNKYTDPDGGSIQWKNLLLNLISLSMYGRTYPSVQAKKSVTDKDMATKPWMVHLKELK
jgi:hypothetical protein